MTTLRRQSGFLSCLLLCLLAGSGCDTDRNDEAGLVPAPMRGRLQRGYFELSSNTVITAAAPLTPAVDFLVAMLQTSAGIAVEIRPPGGAVTNSVISFEQTTDSSAGPEAYDLRVAKRSVSIRSGSAAGAFYAVQTLLQLLPPNVYAATNAARSFWPIRCASVSDGPQFVWRGFMLDVARHFFSTNELRQVLDGLALHKMNRFHFHLTDDQGWRLQIKKHPRLTEIGAWRKHIGFRLDPKSSTAYGPDGRYGGYYTQEDARALVSYAAARNILIVPEVEMPGHASAALAAYPELSCFGGPYSTDIDAGVYDGVFCAGKEQTFEFLQEVLAEIMEVFPGRYIHLGGDEVPKDNWEKCPLCQERMRQENLANEEELQAWFMRRVATFLARHGRVMIGWSEIAESQLPPNAIVMDWVGGGLEAARQGHDVIMTPTRFTYLDYYQSTNRTKEPRTSGGFVPLEKTYEFDPIPSKLEPSRHQHILGVQGNLWTEYVPSLDHAEYMMYPRLAALAEVAWTPKRNREYDSFLTRLRVHLHRLEAKGINHRPLGP